MEGNPFEQLASLLQLQAGDEDSAYGDVKETPTAMTVLGVDPPSLMFAFKVSVEECELSLSDPIKQLLDSLDHSTSVDDGFAWLSLYNVAALPLESIRDLVLLFICELDGQGLAIGPGCARDGCDNSADLVIRNGKVSRVCDDCIESAVSQKREQEDDLNTAQTRHILAFPGMVVTVAIGWALLWFLYDLPFGGQEEIEVEQVAFVGILMAVAAGGCGLGVVLGIAVRRAGLTKVGRSTACLLATAGTVLAGEFVHVLVCVFREIGVFDPSLAASLLLPFVLSYGKGFVAFKALAVVAMAVGCWGAGARREVELQL